MRLSRGWNGLLLFWGGVAGLCIIAAGTLEILGPASPVSTTAQQQASEPGEIEYASRVPATTDAAPPAPVQEAASSGTVEALQPPQAPSAPQEPATTALADHASSVPDPQPAAVPEPQPAAEPEPAAIAPSSRAASNDGVHHQTVPPPGKTLHLRIVRDSERCPRTACYKWHLIQQRLKLSHQPKLDMAQLRLAPSIREAAEKGEVELIIDAVPQHKTVNGRDSVILVATSLTGVMPHDGQ